MGEFHPATWAYMVYTDENGVKEGDPQKPTVTAIYKVRPSQVANFKKKFDVAGAVWVPIYSLMDWTDSTVVTDDEPES